MNHFNEFVAKRNYTDVCMWEHTNRFSCMFKPHSKFLSNFYSTRLTWQQSGFSSKSNTEFHPIKTGMTCCWAHVTHTHTHPPYEGQVWSLGAAGCLHQRGCRGPLHTCCMTGSQFPRLSLRWSWAASAHVCPWAVQSTSSLTRHTTCCYCAAARCYLEHITLLDSHERWIITTGSAFRSTESKLFTHKAKASIHLQSSAMLELSRYCLEASFSYIFLYRRTFASGGRYKHLLRPSQSGWPAGPEAQW